MNIFISGKIKSKNILKISFVIYYFLSSAIHIIINNSFASLISNLIFILIISYNYSNKKHTKIKTITFKLLGVISIYAFLILSEFVAVFFIRSIFSTYKLLSGSSRLIIELISINIFNYFFLLIVSKFKKQQEETEISTLHWVSIFIIPLGTLYATISLIINLENQNSMIVVTFAVFLFIINVIVFYLYDSLLKTHKDQHEFSMIKIQNEAITNQYSNMSCLLENTSIIRHDLVAHLASLENLIIKQEYDDAINYINQISSQLRYSDIYVETNDDNLDSILNYKIYQANNNKITVNCSVSLTQKIAISIFDLTVIISNLMDNAIEATKRIENTRQRIIDLDIDLKDNLLLIDINNPYNGKLNYNNSTYKSTKPDKSISGFGLKSIKNSVNKYNGILEIDHSNDAFHVGIMLYNT